MAYVYMLCTIVHFDEALFITWQRPLKRNLGQKKWIFTITGETTVWDTFK